MKCLTWMFLLSLFRNSYIFYIGRDVRMGKYKICVYAICKNEEKFVERWMNSMKEADYVVVLDTGSTDQSKKKLEEMGAIVKVEEIRPWRFDVARNHSLDLVPKDVDICVCTDLDEVFEAGWRQKLEDAWKPETTRARYNYNWSFDEYGNPAVNFYIEKIHKREGYRWTHPVHEVLSYDGEESFITLDDMTVNHYPDQTKSRSSYLPLLELSVKEDPDDDRNMHYLGREYMYYGRYQEAIDTLKKHLSLKRATWKDERCASIRFIGRCYQYQEDFEHAEEWFIKATQEAPYLRDPFVELGLLYYFQKRYQEAVRVLEQALAIPKNEKSYINEPFCYNGTVEDVLSICYFELGNDEKSLIYVNAALSLDPNNERIINNKKFIENHFKELKQS